MPELPEVETVRNSLKEIILNQTIRSISINYNKIIKNVSEENFISSLVGQTFLDIDRHGKYLIFHLNDYYLISHLRMEGKYLIKNEEEINKHEHIIFTFDDFNMRYHDTRKFGTMHLYQKNINIFDELPLKNVGYEPFDNRLTIDNLYNKFQKMKKPIKTTLLDQKIIAGLGNIYADEVLYSTRINPLTQTNKLSREDVEKILNASRKVLKKAISLGGTTIRSFVSSHDISGRFQNELLIHTKKTCPNCRKEVAKIYVGSRGTYYCPDCQPLR
ncbi:MAG TPA: DNA-formamidopyrimidine glycosylase [Acholeplasmataceae bacterium]|jgi:formamidopyrimidine-DNA glycosylase|nr:DNA-formamidopyrimidine glycosylase [Acholeplasmataceae bacterium]